MYRILELHEKLQQNRKNNNLVKTRTAALDKANYFLRSGAFTDKEVAYHAKLPLFMVEGQKDRIARQNKITRRFLNTGIVQPEVYPHVTIYQLLLLPYLLKYQSLGLSKLMPSLYISTCESLRIAWQLNVISTM